MIPQGPCCHDCPYAPDNSKFIPPDGSGASRILLVGDSPWVDEQRLGKPFAGAAGRMLDRILQFMPGGGLRREDLSIYNTIQCSPPHLGWMDNPRRFPASVAAIEHCRPHLDTLINERRPSVIVPLGNVALRRICGLSGIEAVAGYVLPTPYGIPAVPTYHPSFLLKGKQNLIPVVLWALSRAQSIADGSYKESEYELLLDPDPEVLRGYLRRLPLGGTLFIDIETPESGRLDEEELEEKGTSFVIIRAGFSVAQGSAASFPWTPPYIEIFKEAVALAGVVVEWADNRFDTRRLAAAGVDFSGKQIISGMWAWHWLQSDLRKGLDLVGPFFYAGRPWKHLSQAEPAFYSAMDNSVGMDCYIGIHKALVDQGRWEAFLRYCVQPTPIFESMGKAGLLVNIDYRTQFMDTIKAERDEINGRIQALVPDSVRPRKFWKRPPKDMTGVVALDDVVPPNGAKGLPKAPERLGLSERPCGDELSLAEELFLPNEVESSSLATGKSKRAILPYRFMCVESFNAGSWQQVQDLARSLGVKLPKKEDAEDDEDTSTDEKALKRAMKDKKHGAVFKEILEWRKRNKLITSYSWPLDNSNRVHYQFGFHPSTWRKGCRSVNIQTIPKRSDLAKKFRRMIIAAPAHVLVEGDSCVAPESKILKSDLTWVRADSLKPGDELVAFDEEVGVGHGHSFRASTVLYATTIIRPRVRVHTTQGTVTVAYDHPFAARHNSYKRRWIKAGKLRVGARIAFLAKPWEVDTSWEGGYLAGIFDGEGWLSGTKVGVAQNEGSTLNRILSLLIKRNIPFKKRKGVTTEGSNAYKYGKPNRVMNAWVSTMREAMSVVGSIRPPRLLEKSRTLWEGRRTWGKKTPIAQVLSVEVLESGPVVAIETTTHTYISDGLFSHNSAIEAVILGWLADSERYIRLAKAGVHGWLTSALHGIPIELSLSDTALAQECRNAKKQWPDDYEKCKRVTHLTGYLGTPRRIFEEYPDDFSSEAEARKLQQFLLSTEAGQDIKRWQKATVEEAHGNRYLENFYGLRHRFYTLFQWNPRRQAFEFGDDAKRAVAFRPQSIASFIQTDVVLRMVEWGWLESLRAIIHDSIILEVPVAKAHEAAHALNQALTTPNSKLDGLVIGAEVAIGQNLAPFDASENADGMVEAAQWQPAVAAH